jgi:ribonuclease-3
MAFLTSDPVSNQIKSFIKNVFGFTPHHLDIYKMALVHRSLSKNDAVAGKLNNERLEYLGDAILGAITADFLFRKYPLLPEGKLTEMRSKIVCRANLNALSRKIGLDKQVIIDSHVHAKSVNGDAFEAVMGAIYLDLGYEKTKKVFIQRILMTQLDLEALFAEEKNFKSKVLSWSQKHHRHLTFAHEEIDNHPNKLYKAMLLIDDEQKSEGLGYTIKQAEQAASEAFFTDIAESDC